MFESRYYFALPARRGIFADPNPVYYGLPLPSFQRNPYLTSVSSLCVPTLDNKRD
jgi:hypothetical protein